MRLKVLIVSSYNIKCGIASYAEVLRTLLERDFDVTVAALDQSLLRRTERRVVRAADNHIKALCARFKHYDVINIQWEPGLLGVRHPDIVRRSSWLLRAADRLIISIHAVYPYPQTGLRYAWDLARSHGIRQLNRYLVDSSLIRAGYAAVRKRSRAGNFALVAHTERERRFFRDIIRVENSFDHPLSHIQRGWRERLARDTPAARAELERRFPGKRKFIGVFGFLSEHKGTVTALRAMKYLDEDIQLLIYGGVHHGVIQPRQQINPYIQELIAELERRPAATTTREAGSTDRSDRGDDLELPDSSEKEGTSGATTSPRKAGFALPPLLNKVAFLGSPDNYEFALAINTVDICVFPYQEVGQSASGPVSIAIELGKPAVLARTRAFLELEKYFPKQFEFIEVGNHVQLAQTIRRLLAVQRPKPPIYYNADTLAAFYGDLIRHCAGHQKTQSDHDVSDHPGDRQAREPSLSIAAG